MFRSILICCLFSKGLASIAQELPLNKAANHSMQYYLSLPKNWTADKKWPILVVFESANKEFEKNARLFIEGRGSLPFVIVAPINVNNGNMGRKDPTIFPYSKETWAEIDRVGDCKFNMDGILSIVNEVIKNYNGEEKIFITGFEAGTHALWPTVFQHPEILRAAIPVAGNYNSRTCLDEPVSSDPSRKALIIKAFYGTEDTLGAPPADGKPNMYGQYLNAKKFATQHGFENISEQPITGKGHEPMVAEIFEYLKSLL